MAKKVAKKADKPKGVEASSFSVTIISNYNNLATPNSIL
jgi:hypothetical protein